MVKIRLTRAGAKKRPFYRIIAIDERRKRDGRPLEFLGTYDPRPNPEQIDLETERIEAWVAKGAQLSPTVRSLMRARRGSRRRRSELRWRARPAELIEFIVKAIVTEPDAVAVRRSTAGGCSSSRPPTTTAVG